MRKICLLVSMILLPALAMASNLPPKGAQITFSAGLVANIGFTYENVGENDFIRPTEISSGTVLDFGITGNTLDRVSAPSFNIYYQIFCPYPLEIYADVSPLKPESGDSITWTDAAGTIIGDPDPNYGYLIYKDESEAYAKRGPRSDSKMVSPVIMDVDDIKWETEYTSTIQLRIVAR